MNIWFPATDLDHAIHHHSAIKDRPMYPLASGQTALTSGVRIFDQM
jgi:hypothetical protein